MTPPSVVFVSSCDISPESIIEKVLNCDLPACINIDSNITAYPWCIDNKYYTAQVNLCVVRCDGPNNKEFVSSVDAVVLVFDGNKSNGLETANSWLSFLDYFNAEIKMLVCKSCYDGDLRNITGVSRRSALEWCVEKGFELVELEPNSDDVDPEDEFPDTVGPERIRQALNAHEWSNLVLKSDGNNPKCYASSENPKKEELLVAPAESLEEFLERDDFANLFSQLFEMKSRVANLSGDARKDAAEQVVRAFCKAMGGGDIDDL